VGQGGVAELPDVRLLEGLEAAGGVGVLADLVGVAHRDAAAADPLVGPDRVQEALEGGQLLLGEHGDPADHVFEDVPLGRVAELLAGDLLHRDEADPLLPAGVERLVQRGILVEPGGVLEHDRVDDPPSAAAWMIWARSLWWVEKPTNLALPDFRIASAVSLNSWLFTRLIASSRL
jgi:hypothetical protein